MNSMYIIDGCTEYVYTEHSLKYIMTTNKWIKIANPNSSRGRYAACAVYEGKIIVSGRCHHSYLKSV